LLAIRDTEMSSFVVASADLWLRRAEVEEKRDKVHKESKALLDYTRKAITKLTELKRMLEKFKNDVEKQQVEQMADWQTKLVMMDSKERQYILQVSNYKDKALAALAIEDKKRQYAAAEKYLEDVLQSALTTPGL
uniref:Uncharacterized protein n=1 Tax=Aegilops tauschii subsp. strangulata TaxID=200361 RepID=A0A453RTM1_AEGTS